MKTFQRVMVDGEASLVEVEQPKGHQNPPLTAINQAQRALDEETRDEVGAAVKSVSGAMAQALMGRKDKRAVKPLRPPVAPQKAG